MIVCTYINTPIYTNLRHSVHVALYFVTSEGKTVQIPQWLRYDMTDVQNTLSCLTF